MGTLKRLFEPKPKMVAVPDPMAQLLINLLEEDPSLPRPDQVCGAEVEWITEEEDRHRREHPGQAALLSVVENLQSPRNVSYYESVLEVTPTAEEDLARRRERLLTLMRPMFEVSPEIGESVSTTG